MKKFYLLVLPIFLLAFSFPEDIGLIEQSDVEQTSNNLSEYLDLSVEFEEGTNDELELQNLISENVEIIIDTDDSILELKISELDYESAEELLIDLGVHPSPVDYEVLELDRLFNMTILEERAVIVTSNSNSEVPITIYITYSEDRLETFAAFDEEQMLENEVSEDTDSDSNVESDTTEEVPREYSNALGSAESYIAYTSFSKSGLYEQLLFEGYPEDAAQYAVDNIEVDWNQQALSQAISYLEFSSFSNQGLYEQLIFEGFTDEQASYAIENLPN